MISCLFLQEDVESVAVGRTQDPYDDDFEEFITDFMDDDEDGFIYGMYQYAMHIDKYLQGLSIGNQP